MRERNSKRRWLVRAGALLALVVLAAPTIAQPLAWQELSLPAGGRMILASTGPRDQALVALAFPAGNAQALEDPGLAQLAPLVWLRGRGADGRPLLDRLAEWGWSERSSVDMESASIILHGPREKLGEVLERVVVALEDPDAFTAADLAAARAELAARWQRWAANPEVMLRSEMALQHYSAHPYGLHTGQQQPSADARPDEASLRAWLRERYQAGSALILLAGDIEARQILSEWQDAFEALPGQALAAPSYADAKFGSGRIERDGKGRPNLLLLQLPGPAGHSPAAGPFALVTGVLHQLLRYEMVEKGYVGGASAWYDFTLPGPRPLEIQVRDFPMENLEPIQNLLAEFRERLRQGDYSPYQVITAKDNIFERMDAATSAGDGPQGEGVGPLLVWAQNLLQHNLYFRRWRDSFERSLMEASQEEVTRAAQTWLVEEDLNWGLLLPEVELD